MQTLKEDSSWTFIEEFAAKNGSKHFEIECINCGIHEFIVAHTTPKKCYCMNGGEERMLKMADVHRKSEPYHSDEEEETELAVIGTEVDKDRAIIENEIAGEENEAETESEAQAYKDFENYNYGRIE